MTDRVFIPMPGEPGALAELSVADLRAQLETQGYHLTSAGQLAAEGYIKGAREPSWLVKDFHILYRAALDVSESIADPSSETPPQRFLRAQLERLRPAFEQCEAERSDWRMVAPGVVAGPGVVLTDVVADGRAWAGRPGAAFDGDDVRREALEKVLAGVEAAKKPGEGG